MIARTRFGSLTVTLASALFLSGAIPLIAHANDANCEKAAKAAANNGVHHLVISMEGLMGGTDGRAATYARSILDDSGAKAQVMPFAWTQSSSAASCAKIWKQIHGKNLRVTFVGHSFGGGRGGMSAIEKMARIGVNINDLIVFDGRIGNEFRCGQNGGQQFKRPANVKRVTNFFQCGGMPGRTFTEEPGRVANYELTGSSHISLPNHPNARAIGASVLEQGRVQEVMSSSVETPARSELTVRPAQRQINPTSRSPNPARTSRPAKCESYGVFYDCTYREATQRAYQRSVR